MRRAALAAAGALWLAGPGAPPAAAQDPARPAALSPPAYAELTERYTTARYSTDELRALGRGELARIETEVRAVMAETGFGGSLSDFYDFLRTGPRFHLPDTEAGRLSYMAMAARTVREFEPRLGELMDPPAALGALTVEAMPTGADTPAVAMYGPPAAAGAPGRLSFNLADMGSAPTFQLPAIAYHEGVPGHHLQAAAELDRLAAGGAPRPAIAAFSEGWAHYAERLPRELGLYRDPYANAGRLALEAWRAARLIADIGLAVDGWSREEAIAFLLANTPLSERQARLEIDRCIARPATTSTYILGKAAITAARARAEAALGADFDLRAFHGEVLGHGPLTLPELEETIDRWIAGTAGGAPPD